MVLVLVFFFYEFSEGSGNLDLMESSLPPINHLMGIFSISLN
jgi:hypothetical protein